MIKLIASDLDGTLVSRNNTLSPITAELIKSLEQRGIRFVIATGRSWNNTQPLLEKYDFDFDCILNNGHQLILRDGTTQLHPMTSKHLLDVARILQRWDYHITLYSEKAKYTFMDLDRYFNEHLRISALRHPEILSVPHRDPFFQKEHYLKDCYQVENAEALVREAIPILKIDARTDDLEKAARCIGELRRYPGIALSSSYDYYMEIVEGDYDKGRMIEELARSYGIERNEVAVFGDSSNDLGMIRRFRHSFAPANAISEVRRQAANLVPSCQNDGVYWGIQAILNRNEREKKAD